MNQKNSLNEPKNSSNESNFLVYDFKALERIYVNVHDILNA